MAAVDLRGGDGHGAVHKAFHPGELARFCKGIQLIEDLLGPPDGEGRDYHIPALFHSLGDDLEKPLSPIRHPLVIQIPIGGLEHQPVGLIHPLGITEDGGVRPAQVSAEDQPLFANIHLDNS